MGNSFRGIGCAFPQKSVDFADLNSLCRKVCESLKIRKIFGNFTLDIVSHKQSSRWWVIDMDPYINDYTSSYYLFDLLMTGSFFPEKNLYLIQHEDTVSHATKQSETMSSEATSDTLVTNR